MGRQTDSRMSTMHDIKGEALQAYRQLSATLAPSLPYHPWGCAQMLCMQGAVWGRNRRGSVTPIQKRLGSHLGHEILGRPILGGLRIARGEDALGHVILVLWLPSDKALIYHHAAKPTGSLSASSQRCNLRDKTSLIVLRMPCTCLHTAILTDEILLSYGGSSRQMIDACRGCCILAAAMRHVHVSIPPVRPTTRQR